MENKYAVEMMCGNCYQRVRMWFEKGKEVPRNNVKCPTCGCLTLGQLYFKSHQREGNWLAQVVDTFFNGRKAS